MDVLIATPIENPDEYYREQIEPERLERYLDGLGKSLAWVKPWRHHFDNPLDALRHHFPKNSELIRSDMKRLWMDDTVVICAE